MSYDPALATVIDRIRLALGDTSGDPETEIVPDETYDALLDAHEDWREAAIAIGAATLALLEQDPKSYTAQGDFAVTFRDPKRIEAQIAEWRAELAAEADAETYGEIVTVSQDYTIGRGGATW